VTVTLDKSVACQLDASTSGGSVEAAGLTITLENGGVGKKSSRGQGQWRRPAPETPHERGEIDVRLR